MKKISLPFTLSALVLGTLITSAQTGPFSPEDWPATIDKTKLVHFVTTDNSLTPPSATWLGDQLQILTGGDQGTTPFTIGGHDGLKVTGNNLNVADKSYTDWANKDTIDILVQVYGDEGVLSSTGQPRDFVLLTGTLPEPLGRPVGGQIPLAGENKKWDWVLFRITNGMRADGTRFVGTIPADAQGGIAYGGVNGGTIRFESVPNLIVRAIAFGEKGAFGDPAAVNVFAPPDVCAPEPNTNLVGIDLNAGTTNHVSVLNDGDQTVTFQDAVGPADDKRHAVQPNGSYLNFAVTDNYLGVPCNDPHAVKVCVDFYDDPAFAGADVHFGPEAYATDNVGGQAIFPAAQLQILTGTGKWIRRSWTVPAVDLKGINAGALTAGPRLLSQNGQVFVSRFEMAVLRTGTNQLAGQDPLADCYEDPAICTDAYGNYAELDLGNNVKNGLDVGRSGGDQEMIVAEAGPANDRRQAVRPALSDGTPGYAHNYLNFALTDILGPTSQDPAELGICVTYYDDPALVGATFGPEAYQTVVNGVANIGRVSTNLYVTLKGSGKWTTAYWEISKIKFTGVNQSPAAARFLLSDKIFVTRVRYGVIRPCGPKAGVNPVADCVPSSPPKLSCALTSDNKLYITWPISTDTYTLQSTKLLVPAQWTPLNVVPTPVGTNNTVTLTPTETTFYQLSK